MSAYKLPKSNSLGQASVEFLLLAGIVCIALALGSPSALEQVISALQSAYLSFSNAMSMP